MERICLDAILQMPQSEYPERKRTTVIITEDSEEVHIGVKAIARVFEMDDQNNLTCHQETYGDVKTISKDAPVGCIFDSLKELFESVPEIVDKR